MTTASALFGGGGGLPINSPKPLYLENEPDLHTDDGGGVWLKTGVLTDDTASYPDATKKQKVIFETSRQVEYIGASNLQGAVLGGGFLWAIDVEKKEVHQFTTTFVPTGFTFSLSKEITGGTGSITFKDTFLWIVDSSNARIRQYTTAGVATGVTFYVGDNASNPKGLEWADPYFYVASGSTGKINKYTAAGVYSSTWPSNIGWDDIASDGTNIWVANDGGNTLAQYTTAGAATGKTIQVPTGDVSPRAVVYDGTNLWVGGRNLVGISVFSEYTTVPAATGTQVIMGGEILSPQGLAFDGTLLWLVDNNRDALISITPDGSFAGGYHYLSAAGITYPRGVTFHIDSLWVLDGTSKKVCKFTTAGVYTGTFFSVTDEMPTPTGICSDGTHLCLIGTQNDAVFKYTTAGVYTGTSFSVALQTNFPQGIGWDGTFYWVLGGDQIMYQFTAAGVYNGIKAATFLGAPKAIIHDGSNINVLDQSTRKIVKYTDDIIGDSTARTDSDTGYPIYLKVK